MKTFLIVVGVLLFGVFVWAFVDTGSQRFLTPPDIEGGPVRITDAQGDRLYYLTTQWEKRVSRMGGPRSSSSPRTVSWLFTDPWALYAATAQPVFRKRAKRDRVNTDSTAMGVDQGVLWARIPELLGIRLVDGVIVADSARIEARNPALAGLMPKPPDSAIFLTQSVQPLKFDPDAGLVVLLADAR